MTAYFLRVRKSSRERGVVDVGKRRAKKRTVESISLRMMFKFKLKIGRSGDSGYVAAVAAE